MQITRQFVLLAALVAALTLPATSASAASSITSATACVGADGFAISFEFMSDVVTDGTEFDINANFGAQGSVYGSPAERFAVNVDLPSGAITRQDPNVDTFGDPAFDRWQDGLVEDFTFTDLGGGTYRIEAAFPNGADPYAPGDTTTGAVVRDFVNPQAESGPVVVESCDGDTVGPVATMDVADGQADPANELPVSFSVTFDEDVTGFEVADLTLSGSADPSDATITGSGAAYTVSVASAGSDGSITLGVVDGAVTDGAGNPSTTVVVEDTVVLDTTPPTLTLPSSIETSTDDRETFATVDYEATADEGEVTCTPPSGSRFQIGTTAVECSATDAAGNTATGSFDVTVVDTTAPTLVDGTVPDLTGQNAIQADDPDGATVDYVPPTFDDPSATVTCDPASGSLFPVATTTVTCTATDQAGNTSEVSFNVEVLAAALPAAGAVPGPVALLALLLLAAGSLLTMLTRNRVLWWQR